MKRRDMLAAALVAAGAIAGVGWLLAHAGVFGRSASSVVIDAAVVDVAAPPVASTGNILDFIVFDAYVPPAPTACEALASRNDAVFAALPSRDGCAPSKIDSLPCERVGSATWAIAVDHASVDAECATHVTVKLVRLDGDAGEASGAPMDAIDEAWHVRNAFALRALSDYDGDGSPEILVEHSISAHSGGTTSDASVWTMSAHGIERYAPAAKIEIAGAEDIDADGRIDLLTRGPYGKVGVDESYMSPQAPTIFAAHAMPDGTFLEGDPTARTYARDKCRTAAHSLKSTREAAADDALAIVCARLHGVTLVADAGSSWRNQLAAIDPPFLLSDGGR